MKRILYGFLMFSVGLMAVSCGSDSADETILGYTTDNTIAIVKVNLDRLDEKLPKKEMMNDKSDKFSASEKEKMELFMNAEDNGIDITKPLYLMTDKDKDRFSFSIIGWLDDEAKFEKNFSKISETKITINKEKNLVYSDKELIGSIKDGMIVLAKAAGNPMDGLMGRSAYAPSNNGEVTEKFYADFWNRKPTEKEAMIGQIEKSLQADADMSAWVNVYTVVNTLSKGYIETLAVNKLILDAGVGFNLNFDKGKIDFRTNTFFNEEMQKLVKKYYDSKGVDYDIVKNIELDQAKMYSVGFFSIDFLKYFIKEAGFEPMANSVLQYQGLTLEDITNALNGKYAFAMFPEQPAPADDPYAYPKPSGVLVLGINGDKAGKLINAIEAEPNFSYYAKMFHNKDMLVFATEDSQLEQLKANKAAANKKLNKVSGVNSYTWATGEDFNKGFQGHAKAKVISIESTSKIDGGNGSSETVIKLDKDKKNALHYLFGYE
ncbi:hypothetical protein [uncultured Flavobacterium sp.]|uniref:hypothetical protein n=1 Tax=uncultured Flavobacterium sp. TaxID=165435 RepID=UPI0025FEA07B|nr:hypothetical protein [uncultured Flavobacterium sp.]